MMRFVLLIAALLVSASAFGQVTDIWALDDGALVRKDSAAQYPHYLKTSPTLNRAWNASTGTISIFGAKNEVVAFQVIIQTGSSGVTGISVDFDSLKLIGGSDIISNSGWVQDSVYDFRNRRVELFREYYINVRDREPNDPENYPAGSRPYPDALYMGWRPNALVPVEAPTGGQPFDITATENQAVWCDIYIPKTVTAGTYSGPLTVLDGSATVQTLTVNLQVFDFTLPDTTHLPIWVYAGDIGVSYGKRMGYPNGDEANTAANFHRNRLLAFGHRHRISLWAGQLTYSQFLSTGMSGHFAGYRHTSTYKYDGPGVGVGPSVLAIGTYENPIKVGGAIANGVFGSTQSSWQTQGALWENWCRDSANHLIRFKQVSEEQYGFDSDGDGVGGYPFTDLADDSALYNQGVRTVVGWLRSATGGNYNARYLGTMVTGLIDANAPYHLDGPGNEITVWMSTGCQTWNLYYTKLGETGGIHIRTDPPRKYGYFANAAKTDWRESGMYENVARVKSQGDKIFPYNLGWPAWGYLNGQIDFPATAYRVPGWTKMRYDDYIDGYYQWNFAKRFKMNLPIWDGDYKTNEYMGATLVYPGTDVIFRDKSKDLAGPVATISLKNIRRGIQDYEYMWMAKQLGKLDTNLVKTIVPRALDMFDSTAGYKHPGVPAQWKTESYYYELARAALADTLSGTDGETVVTGTLIATPSARTGAGTVSLAWVTQGADSVHLVWGTKDSLVTASDTIDFYVSATTDVTLNLYKSGSVAFDRNATITVSTSTSDKIANISWEDGTTDWTYYDNSTPAGSYTREASGAYHLSYRAKVTLPAAYNATTPNVQLYSKTFALTSGTSYRLRAKVRGSASSSVRLRLTNSSGTNFGMWQTYSYTSSEDAWTSIDTTFTATATAGNAIVQFLFRLGSTTYTTAGTTFYADSVSLIEQSPAELAAPTWYYPEDGLTGVDIPINAVVNAVPGATSYTAEIDTENTFASPVITGAMTVGLNEATVTWTAAEGIDSGTVYYARAKATGDLGTSAWSDTISFTTVDTLGAKPTIVRPENGAVGQPLGPTLVWTGGTLTEPECYTIEITRDTTGATDTTFSQQVNIVKSLETRNIGFEYLTKYYWRVGHTNSQGTNSSAWSYFTTGSRIGLSDNKRARVRQ